jgi:hypothetical protein
MRGEGEWKGRTCDGACVASFALGGVGAGVGCGLGRELGGGCTCGVLVGAKWMNEERVPDVGEAVPGDAARLAILGLHMPPSTGIVAQDGTLKSLASILSLLSISAYPNSKTDATHPRALYDGHWDRHTVSLIHLSAIPSWHHVHAAMRLYATTEQLQSLISRGSSGWV